MAPPTCGLARRFLGKGSSANSHPRLRCPVPQYPQQIVAREGHTARGRVPGFAPEMQENGAAFAGDDRVAVVILHGNNVVKRIRSAQFFGAKCVWGQDRFVVFRRGRILAPLVAQACVVRYQREI